MIGDIYISPVIIDGLIYSLIVFGSLLLIGFCWEWISRYILSDTLKFESYYPDICECRDNIARSLRVMVESSARDGKGFIQRLPFSGLIVPQFRPGTALPR